MYYFQDPDGNFVEQFQSNAFNSRLWELYLFAVLGERRFYIDRDYPAPSTPCRDAGQRKKRRSDCGRGLFEDSRSNL
jgi:hypothetical protein